MTEEVNVVAGIILAAMDSILNKHNSARGKSKRDCPRRVFLHVILHVFFTHDE